MWGHRPSRSPMCHTCQVPTMVAGGWRLLEMLLLSTPCCSEQTDPGDSPQGMRLLRGVNARWEMHTVILGMLLSFSPQSQWDLGRRGKTASLFAILEVNPHPPAPLNLYFCSALGGSCWLEAPTWSSSQACLDLLRACRRSCTAPSSHSPGGVRGGEHACPLLASITAVPSAQPYPESFPS